MTDFGAQVDACISRFNSWLAQLQGAALPHTHPRLAVKRSQERTSVPPFGSRQVAARCCGEACADTLFADCEFEQVMSSGVSVVPCSGWGAEACDGFGKVIYVKPEPMDDADGGNDDDADDNEFGDVD